MVTQKLHYNGFRSAINDYFRSKRNALKLRFQKDLEILNKIQIERLRKSSLERTLTHFKQRVEFIKREEERQYTWAYPCNFISKNEFSEEDQALQTYGLLVFQNYSYDSSYWDSWVHEYTDKTEKGFRYELTDLGNRVYGEINGGEK